MAQDTEHNYQVLKQLSESGPRFAKELRQNEWAEAQRRIEENRAKGYRIDGMPSNVSYMGVVPRSMRPVPEPEQQEGPSKEEMKAALLAELAAYRKEQEERANAERNAEADDRGEPEGRAGAPDEEAGGNGTAAQAAGGDRERWNEDRGAAQAAERSRGEREPRPKARAGITNNGRPAKLSKEQKAEMYREYCTTTITQPELAEKYGVHIKTVERILADARIEAARAGIVIAKKPKRERPRQLHLTEEQAEAIVERRRAGEKTEDIARELGVSKYQLNDEIYRVHGKTKEGHAKLTDEQRRQIAEEYVGGQMAKATCKKWHIGPHTLKEIVQEAGYEMRDARNVAGSLRPETVEKIEFPNLAEWMLEQNMNVQKLAEMADVKYSAMRRWIYCGESHFMNKKAIDALLEMTGMEYQVLFARKNVGGVKPPRAELERQLETARKALAAFVEWIEGMERNGEDKADAGSEEGDRTEI